VRRVDVDDMSAAYLSAFVYTSSEVNLHYESASLEPRSCRLLLGDSHSDHQLRYFVHSSSAYLCKLFDLRL
jgi:hypothetical protein